MKKKKNIIVLVLIALLSVGGTLAYFNSTAVLNNLFTAGTYKVITHEEFTPPDNWKPGDTTPKTITTTNEGTIPVKVRVKLDGEWTSENGNTLSLELEGQEAAILDLNNKDDWIYEDGYFYYYKDLEPGESTSTLLNSVTFNENIPSSVECTKNAEGTREVCESTGDGYDNATYTLDITTESVQANKYLAAWGLEEPIEKYAMFKTGEQSNFLFKTLAGNSVTADNYKSVADTNIVSFMKSDVEPSAENKQENNIASDDISNYLIYAWFDNGTIYWWSENENTRLNTDSSYMFHNCTSLTNVEGLEYVDTKKVESLRSFSRYAKLSDLTSFSNWDVSNVKDFSNIFADNYQLTNLLPLSNWDTSSGENFSAMFYKDTALASLEGVENWDLSNATTLQFIFSGYTNYNMIYDSLEPLRNWNVSNVENMSGLFRKAINLTEITPLTNWNTSSTTNISAMFQDCFFIESLDGLENWDTSNVTTMQNLFHGLIHLTDADAISDWDVRNVVDMSYLFSVSTSAAPYGYDYSILVNLDISKWRMEKVTNYSFFMEDCRHIRTEFTIRSTNIRSYNSMLASAAAYDGQIIINYTAETESFVDSIIPQDKPYIMKGTLVE